MSQPAPSAVELHPAAPASDIAHFAGDMAKQLSGLCEDAGLHGLATLFFAAHNEAERAMIRLHGSRARNAATGDAA